MSFAGFSIIGTYNTSCPLWNGPFSNPNDFYVEDELFITGRCESGLVRLATFATLICLEALMGSIGLFILCRSIKWGTKKPWGMRQNVLLLVFLASAVRVIVLMLGIFYKLNAAYYIFLSLPLCFLMAATAGVVQQWLVVFISMEQSIFGSTTDLKRQIRKYWMVFTMLFSVVMIVIWAAAAPFRYQNTRESLRTHNSLLAAGFMWITISVLCFDVILIFISSKLKSQIVSTSAATNNHTDFTEALRKINVFTMVVTSSSFGVALGCLSIFVWFLVTINTSQGMAYFFYVLFYFLTPSEMLGQAMIWYIFLSQNPSTNSPPQSPLSQSPLSQSKEPMTLLEA